MLCRTAGHSGRFDWRRISGSIQVKERIMLSLTGWKSTVVWSCNFPVAMWTLVELKCEGNHNIAHRKINTLHFPSSPSQKGEHLVNIWFNTTSKYWPREKNYVLEDFHSNPIGSLWYFFRKRFSTLHKRAPLFILKVKPYKCMSVSQIGYLDLSQNKNYTLYVSTFVFLASLQYLWRVNDSLDNNLQQAYWKGFRFGLAGNPTAELRIRLRVLCQDWLQVVQQTGGIVCIVQQ